MCELMVTNMSLYIIGLKFPVAEHFDIGRDGHGRSACSKPWFMSIEVVTVNVNLESGKFAPFRSKVQGW